MQPIWNPAQSLMQGIGMAQRIRDSLQRQQMEERQLKLAEEEQQRARQVRNIQLLGEIVRNARPVSQDGKVTESTTLDMKVQGVPDFVQQPKPLTVTNEREADPGRTFGFEGNRYEFLSPSDQEARDVERSRLVSEHQNASMLNRLRSELAVKDPYEQKDRDFRAQLQQEQLDAQGMIELARQRAADERAQQAHRWQMMIEQNRQKYQSGEKAMDRQATLDAARARAAGRGGGGAGANDQGLIDAVSANPALFESLTPTVKTRILPALAAAGVNLPNKPLSGEAAKVASVAETMIPEVDRPISEMQKPGFRERVVKLQLGADSELSRLVDNVADKVGRLRSGGAVNKNEEERFRGQVVRWADLIKGDSTGSIQGLKGIRDEANAVLSKMNRSPQAQSGASLGAIQPGERTATNPQTGEKLVLRGGQWVRP